MYVTYAKTQITGTRKEKLGLHFEPPPRFLNNGSQAQSTTVSSLLKLSFFLFLKLAPLVFKK
jgi:hypothetical protein